MAVRNPCGDYVQHEGQRWKIVCFNPDNGLAIFVRREDGKEVRRTRPLAELEVVQTGIEVCDPC